MNLHTPNTDVRILLLEGISDKAHEHLESAGYSNIEHLSTALEEEELIERIGDVHFLGIRSRTQITKSVLDAAPNLCSIGCYCIGTNQVDLDYAKLNGVPVFNAPFANTRSVAELTLSTIIQLMRGIPAKNAAAHRGEWQKTARDAFEVRGKRLGIVGYGNIGSQLSILASALGMDVVYFDTSNKLTHGTARSAKNLEELLSISDVVSLHVPQTKETDCMMNADTLAKMKPGSFLINHARGNLIDIEALQASLDSGHILGAALDVFPTEPSSISETFESPLRDYDQVLISPHVGGSTQEAQKNIGVEVAEKWVRYWENGSTSWAVNFPEANLPEHREAQRVLNIHRNVPGMISQINQIFADQNTNVVGQFLQTDAEIGYVVIDIDSQDDPLTFKQQLDQLEGSLRTRILGSHLGF